MEMLRRFRNFFRWRRRPAEGPIERLPPKQLEEKWDAPPVTSYMGAGCMFHTNLHILGGYQPHKRRPFISGIGGSKEENEDYVQTALREMVEELFHVKLVNTTLIATLRQIKPEKIVMQKGYVILVYTFATLEKMITIVYDSGIISPLYATKPNSVCDLVFNRLVNKEAEISHLSILPFVKHRDSAVFIDREFVRDIRGILKTTNLQVPR